MAKKNSYYAILRREMSDMIAQMDLPELHKQSLKARWLDQVLWMEKKADECRKWHYRLRLTTIVGGVILPALVGLNFAGRNETLRAWFPYLTFGLSQIIAVSAAVEEFCRYGDKWRQYRQTVENLKTEGWQYLQSSGPYEGHSNHAKGYSQFAARVESIIKDDVQSYISELMKQKAKEEELVAQSVSAANKSMEQVKTMVQPMPQSHPNPVQRGTPGQLSGYSQAAPYGAPPAPYGAPQPATTHPAAYPPAPPTMNNGWATPPANNWAAPSPMNYATPGMGLMAAPVYPAAAPSVAAMPTQQMSAMPGSAGLLKVLQDTVFKLSPHPADSLPDHQKLRVMGGSTYGLQSYTPADNQHVQLVLNTGLGTENCNTWFAFAPHVEIQDPNGGQAGTQTNGSKTNGGLQRLLALTQPPSAAPKELRLPVPFFKQTDNAYEAERTCNTSSCAMAAKFLGANISGDDEYYKYVIKHGDTTDHGAQTRALNDLQIHSTWHTNLDFEDLDHSLETGLPIVIGIYHRGTLEAPTGGHMLVVIGRTASGDYICNDPYGSVLDNYQSDPESGNGVVYPRQVLTHRWLAEGPKSGWGRLFQKA